jgi:hypothetical protein
METIWTSAPIAIRGELYAEVKVSANGEITFGTYNDAVQAGETAYTSDQARSIACALIEGADKADEARGQA